MTFNDRYLSETETQQTVTNKIEQASDFVKQNDAKDKPISQQNMPAVAVANTVSAAVPIVQSVENMNDVEGNRTPNDAKGAGDTLARESRKAVQGSSRTPFNVGITESDDPLAMVRGPYSNKLSKKLNQVGLNTGFGKSATNPKQTQSRAGQKDITSGTKASFTLGQKDLGKHARDSLKTAQNVPGRKDITKATTSSMMDSTYFDISQKINSLLYEYTDMDVNWGTNAPGNVKSGRTIHGASDYHTDRTSDTHDMVKNMNSVIDDKQKVQAKNRAATMPEPDKNHAMEQTAGLHMQRSSIVHGADQANAEVRQQKEQRIQSGQPEPQNG